MSASDKKKLRKEQKAAILTERQQNEQKEAKKLKTYTLTFVVIMALVVAIVIGMAVKSPINSVINRNTHAITFGEYDLTTVDFNYYYIDAINQHQQETYNAYYGTLGNYWPMFLGFNLGEPLNKQYTDDAKTISWAQKFVNTAIENAREIYAIYDKAVKGNHKLTESEQKSLDNLEKDLLTNAKTYGYSNVDDYLRISYGDGANLETYKNYCTVSAYAISYATAYSEALEYTADQIREFEKDKFFNYTKFNYSYYLVKSGSYLTGGTKDENGNTTYTDEQRAAALAAAKKDAETLMAASIKDVKSFDLAVKALSINKDNKNAACIQKTNVFYENLEYDELKEWLKKDGHKNGEVASLPVIQKSGEGENAKEETIGYIIVMFQERDDCYTKLVTVRHMLSEFKGYYWDAQGVQHLDEVNKTKAKETAEKWLKEWKEGKATEESFAEMANKYSDDGDGTTGGLYEEIYPGQTVEAFDKWCFDAARKPGDTAVIETEYGHHVMYFVETTETTYRDAMIEADMNAKDCEKWIDGLTEATKIEQVNLNGLKWNFVVN